MVFLHGIVHDVCYACFQGCHGLSLLLLKVMIDVIHCEVLREFPLSSGSMEELVLLEV